MKIKYRALSDNLIACTTVTDFSDITMHSLAEALKKTGLKGRSLISIRNFRKEEIKRLFEATKLMEPYMKVGLSLLPRKVLATLFFEPSTRTKFSFETAMHKLGGDVISESTPYTSSSIAKEESLDDMIRVISKYVDIIVLRHPNSEEAIRAVQASDVPIISGGFGDLEHPTQALLDLYTIWRTFGRIKNLKVIIASPDLKAARTGHSLAYGLAKLDAEIILASSKELKMPKETIENLRRMKASVTEFFDPLNFDELVSSSDVVYFPGCRVPCGPKRDAFRNIASKYFIQLETLEKTKEKLGKMVYVMHPLPRFPGEIDPRIDQTHHALYFKQIEYSIPIRMTIIASILD